MHTEDSDVGSSQSDTAEQTSHIPNERLINGVLASIDIDPDLEFRHNPGNCVAEKRLIQIRQDEPEQANRINLQRLAFDCLPELGHEKLILRRSFV